MARYALGLDYGTGSARALLVDVDTGAEIAQAVAAYAHGEDGVLGDVRDLDVARQHPPDYVSALRAIVPAVMAEAGAAPGDVIGIGVGATGSTPIPVDRTGLALAEHAEFRDEPAAQAWLWKDHTAQAEADEITALAMRVRPEYAARVGGRYSAEWFWAKILHCLRTSPRVFERAWSWVEACDFVPAYLTGERSPERLARSVCAAGHKALFAADWGGLPDAEFLAALDPGLARLRKRLGAGTAHCAQRAGTLAVAVAHALGLRAGTPVAVGALDAHLGAIGAGIRPGDLVKVIGTSSCDMAVAEPSARMPSAAGLCGIVRDSIVPGLFGFEAGQPAVGDLFAWCARALNRADIDVLTAQAARLRPGASGLLALDWHNGNRCVLADPALSGLVVGLGLQTSDAEIYRAMLEATAFGARMIVERLLLLGVPIDAVIAAGGVAGKSPLLMQILADVFARPIKIAASAQASALGAAICGAVVGGAFPDVPTAQRALVRAPMTVYEPTAAARETYATLFGLYARLQDIFGTTAGTAAGATGDVMKALLRLRQAARR